MFNTILFVFLVLHIFRKFSHFFSNIYNKFLKSIELVPSTYISLLVYIRVRSRERQRCIRNSSDLYTITRGYWKNAASRASTLERHVRRARKLREKEYFWKKKYSCHPCRRNRTREQENSPKGIYCIARRKSAEKIFIRPVLIVCLTLPF